MPSIVQVNVNQTVAPLPSALQQTGALISQGGTTTAPGTKTPLTLATDLDAILRGALPLASLTQSGGVATATLKSTTIASGTYDSTTGLVVLTLSAALGVGAGNLVKLSSVTGTGDFADLDGVQTCVDGTTGTTLKFYAPTGLTMTITGGDIVATTGLATDSEFWTTISGAAQAGYNGNQLATVTGDTTFTFPVASTTVSPATGSVTATPPGVLELQQMVNTFFAQGGNQAVYVLELGAGTPAAGVAYLGDWIGDNPGVFYSYLVPRSWAGESTYLTFLAGFEAPTAKTYFFTTMTASNYTSFTDLMKCVVGLVEAPAMPGTEFTLAAALFVSLHYRPSTTNKVTPFAFSYLFGVTPYPTAGNNAFLTALKNAGVNYVGTGAEGGISNTILLWGTTMDGRSFNYWYSVDWLQINVDLDIANAVINGSNDPVNPLYYNQDGINRLQTVGAQTLGRAITYGLALGTVAMTELTSDELNAALDAGAFAAQIVINAIPFIPYSAANPSDYRLGKYSGFTVVYITQQGFISIIFNVNVTDFVTQ